MISFNCTLLAHNDKDIKFEKERTQRDYTTFILIVSIAGFLLVVSVLYMLI